MHLNQSQESVNSLANTKNIVIVTYGILMVAITESVLELFGKIERDGFGVSGNQRPMGGDGEHLNFKIPSA